MTEWMVETSAHLRKYSCVCLSLWEYVIHVCARTDAHLENMWCGWRKEWRKDQEKEIKEREVDKEKEKEREYTRARARAHACVWVCKKEGIQYNCTHVYRVDGNILERILKYLLVVWVEGERCLSRCHLDCAIEAPMWSPLQNLTIKIALGL